MPESGGGGRIGYTNGGVTVTVGNPSTVELRPRVWQARLTGMLFDTDKTFLLPGAMKNIRALKRFYDQHPGLAVLVSGHADRAGAADYNLRLSAARAQSIADFLTDKVDGWLPYYGTPPVSQKWGAREDALMLTAVLAPDGTAYGAPGAKDALRRFQRDHGLADDGVAGPATRRELVRAYMALDATSLPAGTSMQTHGCGEYHPVVATADGAAEQANRRVEVFLFEGAIDPPPRSPCPTPGCPEYPIWVERTVETIDLDSDENPLEQLQVALCDVPGAALLVSDGDGGGLRTMTADQAERRDSHIIFTLDPAKLPKPTWFRCRDSEEAEPRHVAGPCDPIALRNAIRDEDWVAVDALVGSPRPEPAGPGGDDGDGDGDGDDQPRDDSHL